jgi:hypothetical protein
MCRYTYPHCEQGWPCVEECEIYRANCPFPLPSCASFPSQKSCCYRFTTRRMPYNPAIILMPFSPVVFGLLLIAGAVFYWWVICRQSRAQDLIRSRKLEFEARMNVTVGVAADGGPSAAAADNENLLRRPRQDAAAEPEAL